MRITLPAVLTLGLLAGCTDNQPRAAAVPPPPPRNTVASSAPAESCLQLSQIRESRVIDDRTIDFITRDGRTYRNTLPNSCPQLGFEKAFTYETSLSQLCSVDIIRVIIQGGGPRIGASCGLGKFVPFTPVPK